jgi:aminopeptidase N
LPISIANSQASERIVLTRSALVPGTASLVNAGGTAYARVAYPSADAAALADRMAQLAPMDQLTLMNDAWALGQSGYAPAQNLLAYIAKLPAGADPIIWQRAVGLLITVDRAYGLDPTRSAFRGEALKLLERVTAAVGTVPHPGESPNTASLRSDFWLAQVRFGDAEALERAQRIVADGEGSIADQRAALDIVGLAADERAFDALLTRVQAAHDPLEKGRILEAMALANDPSLAARMVDIALGPDVPAGSSGDLLAIAGTENPDSVWHALEPYLAKGPLPIDPMTRWYVVTHIAAGSAEPNRIDDVRHFGEQDMPADARRPVEAAVASIKLNERVKAGALPDIDRWIASQAR